VELRTEVRDALKRGEGRGVPRLRFGQMLKKAQRRRQKADRAVERGPYLIENGEKLDARRGELSI